MEDGHAAHGGSEHAAHRTSIWPFVLALAGGFGFGGLATQFWPFVGAGVVLLIVGVWGWVRQDLRGISFAVKQESEDHPFTGISVRKLGMWLFIISEVFFFTGLIAAGLALRVRAPFWPTPGTPEFPLNIPLTAINTFVLLASSFTMAEAVHSAQVGKLGHLRLFLGLTLGLGAVFVGIQVYEYSKLFAEHLTPWPNLIRPELGTFGTAFYAQTGFHGAHVTGGLLGLAYLNAMAWKGRYGKENYEGVEVVGLYWHLVDVVWIFLFPLMYLIGR
jgi:heme/copper-type cytochrome/quinol oxidase subunit 3